MRRLSGYRHGIEVSNHHFALNCRSKKGVSRMNSFEYQRVKDTAGAVQSTSTHSKFLAGGTNLIDLMKNNVEHPDKLIDINRVALAAIETLPDGGLRLGSLARNSDTANHPLVRQKYPLLSRAILSGAS